MKTRWILIGAAMTAAAGCVVNEPESPPRGVVVSGPPPAPVHEDRPPPPGPAARWVAGYWHWTGMQYAWIPGHWEAPPAGATGWAPPTVTPTPDGRYVYESGSWHGRAPLPASGASKAALR